MIMMMIIIISSSSSIIISIIMMVMIIIIISSSGSSSIAIISSSSSSSSSVPTWKQGKGPNQRAKATLCALSGAEKNITPRLYHTITILCHALFY